jgi:hypothetical protein
LENVTKNPFANPIIIRPMYRTLGVVLAIWTAHATALKMQAIHRAERRPRKSEANPARSDEVKEPKVSREDISCWTVLFVCISILILNPKYSDKVEPYINPIAHRAGGILESEYLQESRHCLKPTDSRAVKAILHVGYRHHNTDY